MVSAGAPKSENGVANVAGPVDQPVEQVGLNQVFRIATRLLTRTRRRGGKGRHTNKATVGACEE